MEEKPFRVVNEAGVAWGMRFISEESAWGRIFALKGQLADTPTNRRRLEKEGWSVVNTDEITSR